MFAWVDTRPIDVHAGTAVPAVAFGLLVGVLVVVASPVAALGGLVGGAMALAILRAPVTGLFGLVVLTYLLPFAVIPVRLGPQLTALEAVLGLTLGATLMCAVVRRERLFLAFGTTLVLALFVLAALSFILSLPYAGGQDMTRRVVKLFLAMLVLPLTLHLARDAWKIQALLVVLVLAAALEAGVSIGLYRLPPERTMALLSALGPLGYPTGEDILRYLPGPNDTYSDVLRATGTSVDPNALGGTLMLGAAVTWTQLIATRPLLPRWLLGPAGVVLVTAMLMSHSRSSWIGLAMAMLTLATLRYRRLWLLILPTAAVVAVLPAARALYARVLAGFAAEDKAAGMRLDEYRNALEIIQQYPLLGIGFGQPPSIDLAAGVSSLYLTVAETMGLPALGIYCALILWLVVRALRALRTGSDTRSRGVLSALLAAVVAALTAGLFDHYFASTAFPHAVALFWLCCGLLWRSTEICAAESALADRPSTLLLDGRPSESAVRHSSASRPTPAC